MTTSTKQSPVRSFDHGRYAEWPEYDAVAHALDAFAHRLNRENDPLSTRDFGRLAADLAAILPYSDACPSCDGEVAEEHRNYAPYAPLTAKLDADGEWIECTYRCDHGHRWRCGWGIGRPQMVG